MTDTRRGYLQQHDGEGLAAWAEARDTAIRLLVRPGDYVFPGAPIVLMRPSVEGADAAIRSATALGGSRGSSADIEFAVRQLVEVAVRALSPGINDPHTAMSVLHRLDAVLCDIARTPLPTGVWCADDHPSLVGPSITYDGLTDTMLHMVRQNAAQNTAVLIRLIEVLSAVSSCERDPPRVRTLQRHADLVLGDAARTVKTPADLADVARRHEAFMAVRACQEPST